MYGVNVSIAESCEIVLEEKNGGGKRLQAFRKSVRQAWRDG